jgi:hypothetical protein
MKNKISKKKEHFLINLKNIIDNKNFQYEKNI